MGEMRSFGTVGEAKEFLETQPMLSGAIIDLELPDGSGFEIVEQLRELFGSVPVLVLTGHGDQQHVNRAQLLGAMMVVKPGARGNLNRFFEEAANPTPIARAVSTFVEEHKLTPREADVVELLARGMPPKGLGRALGVKQSTVVTLRKRLLKRCELGTLADVVRELLRIADEAGRQDDAT